MFLGPSSAPLAGIVVLELSVARAGPTAGRQLADLGANVIRVEPPPGTDGGDDLRHGGDFQNLHRNKRSIVLDLKSSQGAATFRALAIKADVIVENFRPDVKRRLGIDYESLKAINKRIVYASISGFGQDGPYVERPGVDQIAQGVGGMMSVTGEPGRGPMRAGIPIADLCTGVFAAYGILAALIERQRSGEGQWISASLIQSQLFMLDLQAARWLVDGHNPGQAGNNHPTGVPTGVFRTSDGHINIAPIPAMWRRFCTAMGMDLAEHEDYRTPAARVRNRDTLNTLIEELTKSDTSAAWIDRLNAAGIPCGPINSVREAFADPQVQHLGIAAKVQSKALGEIELVRQPLDLSRTPAALYAAAPERGEHTAEVLAEFGIVASKEHTE